jgi:predicted GNAT family N-acyltransferase
MQVRSIQYDSPEYQHELQLRNRLLRIPLGLDVFDEDLAAERGQWHFGLFRNGHLLGCVVAAPLDDGAVRIRQMAVESEQQRTGCGRMLLDAVERELANRGMQRVTLHARIEAVGFYAKLGYTPMGEEFVEVGIPHRAMEKSLDAR